jgi:acyl carrier protein
MPAEANVGRVPPDPDEVLRVIRDRLAEILEIDDERITRETRFAADLDADSLALVELVEAIEEEFGDRTVGFVIDDDDLADLQSVGDAVDYVMARLSVAGT